MSHTVCSILEEFPLIEKGITEDILVPVYMVLYSLKIKEEFPFKEGTMIYEGEDDLMKSLCDASKLTLSCRPNLLAELKSLYKKLQKLKPVQYQKGYSDAVDWLITCCQGYEACPTFLPRHYLPCSMVKYVERKGALRIADPYAALGTMAISVEEPVHYVGLTESSLWYLFSRVLHDAFEVKNPEMFCVSNFSEKYIADCDAIVSILPMDYGAEDKRWSDVIESYERFFTYVFKHAEKLKAVSVVVRWNFMVEPRLAPIREMLLKMGCLDKVMSLPDELFYDLQKRSCALFLDFTEKHDCVEFVDGEDVYFKSSTMYFTISHNLFSLLDKAGADQILTVPYAEITEPDFCLSEDLYRYDEELEDGQEWCSLGELISLDPTPDTYEGNVIIDRGDFTTDLERSFIPVKMKVVTRRVPAVVTVQGKRLLMTYAYDQRVKLARLDSSSPCGVSWLTYPILVNESKISYEYLSYVLLNDDSFDSFMSRIVDQYDVAPNSIMLKRRIPVYRNLCKQREVVDEYINRKKINVVWADDEIGTMADEGILQQMGERGLFLHEKASNNLFLSDLIEKSFSSNKESQRIDAIILNPTLSFDSNGSCDHFQSLMDILNRKTYWQEGKWNCPIFLCTDVDRDQLGKFFENSMYSKFYEPDNIFSKTKEGYARLFQRISEVVEDNNFWTFQMRNIYRKEYDAAQWVDEHFGTRSLDLLASVKNPYENLQMISGYDLIRDVVHKIIGELQRLNAVPSGLDKGAVPRLLLDGCFKDKSGFFYCQQNKFMPEELAQSLCYFTDMANRSVHGRKTVIHLQRILIDIMSELEIWFYDQVRFGVQLTSRVEDWWTMQSQYEFEAFDDEVNMEMVENKPYYYSRNVHLYFRPGLEVGKRVFVKSAGEERIKREMNGQLVVFFSKDFELL